MHHAFSGSIAEIICLHVYLLDPGVIHACEWPLPEKPNLPVFSYKFQGIFNANEFGELAVHTESEMIFFLRLDCC